MKDQAPHNTRFTFRKAERLCSQKIISGLFQPGFFVSVYPFRINALITELPPGAAQAQVIFVVGKKKFKKAVDRNRVKRIMRELYRLEKQQVYDSLTALGKQAAVAIIYTGSELPIYKEIQPRFHQIIKKFCHAIPAQ